MNKSTNNINFYLKALEIKEEQLANLLGRCIDKKHSMHLHQLIGNLKPPSRSWVDSFLRKNKKIIKKKKSKRMALHRVISSTPESFQKYFDVLTHLWSKHQYHPSLIFNFDETGCTIDKRHETVILPAESGAVGVNPVVQNRFRFTMGATIAADGSLLPPFVILPGANVPELPEFILEWGEFHTQPNAWITTELFEMWMYNIMLPYIHGRREFLEDREARAMIVVDNHSTRRNEALLTRLEEEKVDLVFLPPNTSHISQPLDVLVFGGMKTLLSKKIQRRISGEDRLPVVRSVLVESSIECLESIATRSTIRKSFNLCGIYPLDASVFTDHPLVGSPPESLVRKAREQTERMTVTGPEMRNKLAAKRIEKEREKKEKEERKKIKESGTKRKTTDRRINRVQKIRKRRRLDWEETTSEESEEGE